jgi:hypothetical protein
MIRAIVLSAAASAAMLIAGPAIAQRGAPAAPPPGGGVGGNGGDPYARPMEMGETDSATMPSREEQIRRGMQAASDARAAEQARSKYGRAVPAKASEVIAQAAVYDLAGQTVGTIEAVDPDGAVVATAVGKVKVPLNAFGKNKLGLLVGVSKKDFEAQVTKANASPIG